VPGTIGFTESELCEAVAGSRSCAEVLRKLGLRPAGGNHKTFKKYVALWGISTAHFDQAAIRREALSRPPIPLADVLVEHSTYHRGHLKRRLLAEGIKQPVCELCGQGDTWRGRPLALILDHINGVPDDNPLLISGRPCRRLVAGGGRRRRHVVDGENSRSSPDMPLRADESW
jgi:hypothetical protein